MLGVEPEAVAHRGHGPRRRLAAGEVLVHEVEHPEGGERVEPLGPPSPGERAGTTTTSESRLSAVIGKYPIHDINFIYTRCHSILIFTATNIMQVISI